MTCKHTPMPAGYVARALWMEEKAKTHEQRRCPECGLWAVWVRQNRWPLGRMTPKGRWWVTKLGGRVRAPSK